MEIEGATALVDEALLLDCAEASVRGVGLLGEQAGLPLFSAVPDQFAVPADLAHLVAEHGACEHPGGFNQISHSPHTRRVGSRPATARGWSVCSATSTITSLADQISSLLTFAHDRLQWTSDGRVRLIFT